MHKFQGWKKKIQPLSGGHCAYDISRTKHLMIFLEATWAWLVREMNDVIVLGIWIVLSKHDARRPPRPLLHKKQEGLDQRNTGTKALVHFLQSSLGIDLSHTSWRELWLHPEHCSVNCAAQECKRERLGSWSQSGDVFAQQSADNSVYEECEVKQPNHITPHLSGRLSILRSYRIPSRH